MASNNRIVVDSSSDRVGREEINRRRVAAAIGPKNLVVTLPLIDGNPMSCEPFSFSPALKYTALLRIIKGQLSTSRLINEYNGNKPLPKYKVFIEFEGNHYELTKGVWAQGMMARQKATVLGLHPKDCDARQKIVVECDVRPVKVVKAKRAARAPRKNKYIL